MNKIERPKAGQPSQFAGYDQDFALWSSEQAALIRAGRLDSVDLENVAEEIESLGRSDRREISKRLGVLLEHLLKWQFQPAKRKMGWRSTIREQRSQILQLVEESPSLKNFPGQVMGREYSFARGRAADQTGMSTKQFPTLCPYRVEDVLDDEFFPGEPWQSGNEDD